MKHYLLFAGSNYYPSGGMQDYKGDFDSVEEAITHFKEGTIRWPGEDCQYTVFDDWFHVAYRNDMSIVASGYR